MFFVCSSLGIDVGNRSVRMVLLRKNKRGIHVCAMVEEKIGDFSLHQIFVKAKHQLKKASLFPYFLPKNQIMAVAQSQVAIKRFAFELNSSHQEKYMQLGMQLSENLGLASEELLYDYHSLAEPNMAQAYACRFSLLEDKLSALAKSGYQLSVLELQTQSLMRLYYKKTTQFNNKIALLVDIEFERVQLLLSNGKADLFYRELPCGVDYSAAKATEIKKEATEQLAENILRQYQQIHSQFPYLEIEMIWLCGEGAKHIDRGNLQQKLNREVSLFDPFEGLHFESRTGCELVSSAENWTTAVGLAMRGIMNATH